MAMTRNLFCGVSLLPTIRWSPWAPFLFPISSTPTGQNGVGVRLMRWVEVVPIFRKADAQIFWLSGCYVLPFQPIDATHALNLSAGVSNSKVFRGLSFNWRATPGSLCAMTITVAVPLTRFRRPGPVFDWPWLCDDPLSPLGHDGWPGYPVAQLFSLEPGAY